MSMIQLVNLVIALVVTYVIFRYFSWKNNTQDSEDVDSDRRAINAVIYQERLLELESERYREAMTEAVFTQLKNELQSTLLRESDGPVQSSARRAQLPRGWLGALLLIPILMMTTYFFMTDEDVLQDWEASKAGIRPIIENMLAGESFDREKLNEYDVSTFVRVLQDFQNQYPEKITGWLMLANIFLENGMVEPAYVAAKKAYFLAPIDQKPIVQFAEIMIAKNNGVLTPDSEKLMDQYLEQEAHPALLGLKADAAYRGGQYQVALEAWQQLYDLSNDIEQLADVESISAASQEKIAAGRQFLMQKIELAKTQLNANLSEDFYIKVLVKMDDALKSNLSHFMTDGQAGGATLFVILKDAAGSRMPLAVKKIELDTVTAAAFPIELVLSQQDAMIESVKFETIEQFQLIARLSKSGQAIKSMGDWEGRLSNVKLSGADRVSAPLQLMIDTVQ